MAQHMAQKQGLPMAFDRREASLDRALQGGLKQGNTSSIFPQMFAGRQ
jgi:hypothetical protein